MTITPQSLSQAGLASLPLPQDIAVLLEKYQSQLPDLGLPISDDPDVEPWADESYLTESAWANPDIAANVKAMRDIAVKSLIHCQKSHLLYFSKMNGLSQT